MGLTLDCDPFSAEIKKVDKTSKLMMGLLSNELHNNKWKSWFCCCSFYFPVHNHYPHSSNVFKLHSLPHVKYNYTIASIILTVPINYIQTLSIFLSPILILQYHQYTSPTQLHYYFTNVCKALAILVQ